MKRHKVCSCLAVLLSIWLLSTVALAQLPLSDDTYTTPPTTNNPGLGTTNYGGGPYLLVQGPARRPLFALI